MSTPLRRALWLTARGLSVIPLPYGSKVPVIAWKEFQERLTTEVELRRWFASPKPNNMAAVTGLVSGIVVLDADTPEADEWVRGHLQKTPWMVATAHGRHYYFQHPGSGVTVRNKARVLAVDGRLQLDVRADGGYVVAPGSVHARGITYSLIGDWRASKEELPVFDVALIEPPARTRTTTPTVTGDHPRPQADALKRATAYLGAIPIPIIGSGSDVAVFSAACRLVLGFGLDEDLAIELLWGWCGNRPGWTVEWVEAKVRSALRFGTEPVGGLLEARR